MKELKVILSPHFNKEVFKEEVSGIEFHKGNGLGGIVTYTIDLQDNKLSGIQSALRKNILLPHDRETLEFVNNNNISEGETPSETEPPVEEPQPEPEQEPEQEPQPEQEPEEVKVEAESVKKTRKRTTKKESE